MGFKKKVSTNLNKKIVPSSDINISRSKLFHRKYSEKKGTLWKEINDLSIIAKKEISYYNLFSQSPPKMPKFYEFCNTIISKNEFGEVQGYLIYVPWENVRLLVNQVFKPMFQTPMMYDEWIIAWLDYWASLYDCKFLSTEKWTKWNILCQIYVKKPFRKNGIAKNMFEEYFRITSDIEKCVCVIESPNRSFHIFSKRIGYQNGRDWFWYHPRALYPDILTPVKYEESKGRILTSEEVDKILQSEGMVEKWNVHEGVNKLPRLDDSTWKYIENNR